MYLIVYDICDAKRLRQTAKLLQRYGRRVQKSVFECDIKETRYRQLFKQLQNICKEKDCVASYHLQAGTFFENVYPPGL